MDLLGFPEEGQHSYSLVENGTIAMDGELPVNPSGGVICTNPIGATGLIRAAEAASQILERAGDHQVDGARLAMSTGFGGSNWNEVLIFANA